MKGLVYILQKENYDTRRFLRFAYSHFKWWRLEKRQRIVWTAKAKLIYILTWIILLIIILSFFLKTSSLIGLTSIFAVFMSLPIIISVSLLILYPFDSYLKYKKKTIAKKIIKNSDLIVIGITGSYGKTSAKEILSKILEKKFKIIKTPENVNTDIGVANFIIKNKNIINKNDIFVVEMGAYKRYDIKKICSIVNPKYSILTGINEAHLDRFGSLENTIKTKFELPENTQRMSVLNFEDKNIRGNYQKFKINNFCIIDNGNISNIKIEPDFKGLSFGINNVEFSTCLLGLHNIILINLCAKIAEELGIGLKDISDRVKEINHTPHRLSPIYNSKTNINILDDSYNGNVDGIKSGLDTLSRAHGRKVVLTPGLVELGKKSKEIHSKIGKWYTEYVDLVLLIDNKHSKYIAESLDKYDFKNYIIYKNTQEAHDALAEVLKPGDTILFQNDLTDNYL